MSQENSYRDATTPNKVVSKYFSENLVMDEDSKEIAKVKRNVAKKPQEKPKTTRKRPTKTAKGQKDIRTLIKSKKNELLKYFDLICKQSGIDVDPEQLQLAIALSKSLEDSNKCTESGDNIQTNIEKYLTFNQRRSKIRTTLQEYGFQTKSAPVKKVKRYRKPHKLILVPDTEKQQRIADKYSEILIRNVSISKVHEESFCNNCINSYLYNLTTNVSYDCLKNDDIFHVSDLVPKSLYVKSKLKDWSTIPGRPVSPKIEVLNYNFKNIQCSQEELDIILSGPLDVAQDIVKRNHTNSSLKSNISYTESEINQEIEINSKGVPEGLCGIKDKLINSAVDVINYNIIESMALPVNRSCSPDLFDDEVTIIMESSTDKIAEEAPASDKTVTVNEKNDFMEFTNCIGNINANYTNSKHIACFSQGSNRTRSNSNDFMDLTEPACSQKNIPSTGSNNQANENCSVIKEKNDIEVIDLYQSQKSINIKASGGSDEKSLDDTIIIIDEDCGNINAGNKFSVNAAAKDRYIIDLEENQQENNGNFNTTQPKQNDLIVNLERSLELNDNTNLEKNYGPPDNVKTLDTPNSEENCESAKEIENLDTVDLTQPSNFENCLSSVNVNSVQSLATFEVHTNLDSNLSDPVRVKNSSNTNENGKDTEQKSDKYENIEEMDLTQSSDSGDSLQEIVDEEMASLDETVIITNEHDNLFPFVPNEVERNDIEQDIELSNSNSKRFQSIEQNNISAENNIPSVNDTDNDREFDDLVEQVSYSKQSNHTLYADKIISDDNSYSANNLNNQEIDLTQSYTCNSYKSPEPYKLSNKSINVDDNGTSLCESMNDESCVIDVEEQLKENAKKCYEKPNTSEIILTSNQNESLVDYDNQSEFHNISKDVSKSVQYEDKDVSNIQCQNILNEDDAQNSDIDLTQQSDSSEDTSCRLKSIEVPSELGRRYDISIDYDEVCGRAITTKDVETTSLDINKYVENDNNTSKDEGVSNASQQSEVFELSDTELNYSINQHMQENETSKLKQAKFDIGGLSIIDDFLNRNSLPRTSNLRCSCGSNSNLNINDNEVESCFPVVNNIENLSGCNVSKESKSCEEVEVKFVNVSTPLKSRSEDNILIAKTPKHDDYIIKTDQVTPMPNYEKMTSPERNEELDKFGIKPLKRKRAIQILTHIYNQTHPLMEVLSNDECSSPSKKRRRKNDVESFPRRVIASQIDLITKQAEPYSDILEVVEPKLSQKTSKSCTDLSKARKSPKNSSSKENILYEETSLVPDIRNIECSPEDWIFQKREKAKVHSCRVPLHIAFHNYVSSRRALREAILKYEPINIDDIHKGLVANGYRYNPKDLLKFMDRKCITVKTADNSKKNK